MQSIPTYLVISNILFTFISYRDKYFSNFCIISPRYCSPSNDKHKNVDASTSLSLIVQCFYKSATRSDLTWNRKSLSSGVRNEIAVTVKCLIKNHNNEAGAPITFYGLQRSVHIFSSSNSCIDGGTTIMAN